MDVRREIEELVGFGGRSPGTDAERRAGRHLERRLRELGRDVDVEAIDVWPFWQATYAIHAVVAVVGSVVSVSSPVVGAALVLAATVLTVTDATGALLVTRRLLGRRASQNVVSREDGGKPGVLVVVAHYDAGRGGAAFAPRLQERRAAVSRLVRRQIGPLDPLVWSMLAVSVCTLLRLVGVEGTALTAVQFVPTVVLIVAVPLLADIALTDVVPGANDNASGVATALGIAERHGRRLDHFDVWMLLTGSQEGLAQGMRAFLRRHRRQLDRERTVVLNVDEVGSGTVRYTRREGPVLALRSHVQLVELCDEIAEDDEDVNAFGARPLVSRAPSDGYAARSAGFPAITTSCRNALGYAPEHHQPTDTPERIDDAALERAFGFCSELIERLDAAIGPELAQQAERDRAYT